MTNQMKDLSKYPAMDYFMNEDLCDVVLIYNGQRVPALKSLLSIKNKVFRKMFSEKQNEKNNNQKPSVIKIDENMSFESFKTFIQYLHCDQLFLKEDNGVDGLEEFVLISDLLHLTKKYEAIHLFDIIYNHLNKMTVSFTNLVEILCLTSRRRWWKMVTKDGHEELIVKVMAFIDHNWDEFVVKRGHNMDFIDGLSEGRLFQLLAEKYLKLNNEKKIGFNNKEPENYNQSKVWVTGNDSQRSSVFPKPHSTKSTNNSFKPIIDKMTNQTKDLSKYPAMDYFMNEDLCDVVMIINGQRLPLLSSLLCIKNRFIRDIFSGKLNEKNDNQKPPEIKLNDENIDFESFKTFIQYLHCDQLFLKEDDGLDGLEEYELILKLLNISKTFKAIHLFDIIHRHLNKITINLVNLSQMICFAFRNEIEDLIAKVMAFIDHNWDEFVDKWGEHLDEFNVLTEGRLFDVLAEKYLKLKKEKNIWFNNKNRENYNQSKVWVKRNGRQRSCAVVPNPHSTKSTYNSTLIFNGKGFEKIKFKPFRARNVKEKDPRFNAKKTSPDN